MLQEFLDWLAGPPKETHTRLADVKPGRVAVEGKLRSRALIPAPIGRTQCAGYFYHATYLVGSRTRGMIRRRLQDALVYAPELRLELEGGALGLLPLRCDRWSDQEHRDLLGLGHEGFEATEQIIRDGARVRVVGRVRSAETGEGLVLCFNELHLLEGTAPSKRARREQQLLAELEKPRKKGKR